MKIKDLKKMLENVSDDFTIDLFLTKRIPEEDLKGLAYPYPFEYELFSISELRDIGYSSKKIAFEIEKSDH